MQVQNVDVDVVPVDSFKKCLLTVSSHNALVSLTKHILHKQQGIFSYLNW